MQEINRALRRHFEQQEPVRYELGAVKVQATMPKGHPMEWDAFYVKLKVNDLTKSVRGLRALDIDVAAPEELLDHSISTLVVGFLPINAYTLERITGEKLRVFLRSLPTYQAKINSRKDTVRARDLYDLFRIRQSTVLNRSTFGGGRRASSVSPVARATSTAWA